MEADLHAELAELREEMATQRAVLEAKLRAEREEIAQKQMDLSAAAAAQVRGRPAAPH